MFTRNNIKLYSKINPLKTGITDPDLAHILSFRRQVYVDPEDVLGDVQVWGCRCIRINNGVCCINHIITWRHTLRRGRRGEHIALRWCSRDYPCVSFSNFSFRFSFELDSTPWLVPGLSLEFVAFCCQENSVPVSDIPNWPTRFLL